MRPAARCGRLRAMQCVSDGRWCGTAVVVIWLALLGGAATAWAAPANDDFEQATPLVGFPVAVEGSNIGGVGAAWRTIGLVLF